MVGRTYYAYALVTATIFEDSYEQRCMLRINNPKCFYATMEFDERAYFAALCTHTALYGHRPDPILAFLTRFDCL